LVVKSKVAYADARSFGEAFHVSAACVLNNGLQWKVGGDSEAERERARSFLKRTTKAPECTDDIRGGAKSTDLVAEAFERDPSGAQRKLKEAWLSIDPERKVELPHLS
jgi:hypothetical protein